MSTATITTPAGAAIAWDAVGDPDATPLVLIQGFSAQRLGWRPGFCAALAEAGFRVIRFDNRDVGESQRYPEGGYALADLADDTAALLDGLGLESAHIVGQSMGGMIAQLLATAHPERVRSLGLLYTTASTRHFIDADAVVAERIEVPPPTSKEEFRLAYVASEAACASPGYPQDTAWLAEVAGELWDHGVDPAGVGRQLQALLAFPDRLEAARALRVPTAIIAGDGDGLIDHAASIELHEAIAGSSLDLLAGMGHELPEALWPELVAIVARNARLAERQLEDARG